MAAPAGASLDEVVLDPNAPAAAGSKSEPAAVAASGRCCCRRPRCLCVGACCGCCCVVPLVVIGAIAASVADEYCGLGPLQSMLRRAPLTEEEIHNGSSGDSVCSRSQFLGARPSSCAARAWISQEFIDHLADEAQDIVNQEFATMANEMINSAGYEEVDGSASGVQWAISDASVDHVSVGHVSFAFAAGRGLVMTMEQLRMTASFSFDGKHSNGISDSGRIALALNSGTSASGIIDVSVTEGGKPLLTLQPGALSVNIDTDVTFDGSWIGSILQVFTDPVKPCADESLEAAVTTLAHDFVAVTLARSFLLGLPLPELPPYVGGHGEPQDCWAFDYSLCAIDTFSNHMGVHVRAALVDVADPALIYHSSPQALPQVQEERVGTSMTSLAMSEWVVASSTWLMWKRGILSLDMDLAEQLPALHDSLRSVFPETRLRLKLDVGEEPTFVFQDQAVSFEARDVRLQIVNDAVCQSFDGIPCVFPFEYGGSTYSGCTAANWITPWCATAVSGSGSMSDWGHCSTTCVGSLVDLGTDAGLRIEPKIENQTFGVSLANFYVGYLSVDSSCNTLFSEPCVFPFTYNFQTYTECTTAGTGWPGYSWCATEVDWLGVVSSGRWGVCSPVCSGFRALIMDPINQQVDALLSQSMGPSVPLNRELPGLPQLLNTSLSVDAASFMVWTDVHLRLENPGDLMTKYLDRPKLDKFCKKLGYAARGPGRPGGPQAAPGRAAERSGDREMAWLAVREDPEAFVHADKSLRGDKGLAMEALRRNLGPRAAVRPGGAPGRPRGGAGRGGALRGGAALLGAVAGLRRRPRGCQAGGHVAAVGLRGAARQPRARAGGGAAERPRAAVRLRGAAGGRGAGAGGCEVRHRRVRLRGPGAEACAGGLHGAHVVGGGGPPREAQDRAGGGALEADPLPLRGARELALPTAPRVHCLSLLFLAPPLSRGSVQAFAACPCLSEGLRRVEEKVRCQRSPWARGLPRIVCGTWWVHLRALRSAPAMDLAVRTERGSPPPGSLWPRVRAAKI
ncbi:unnamed protein product [Prorocentrum cordatum]|uniref:Fibronectin type-II domain-containing protein n=1 Tax=Prorocentrum cordatum TaxID=2364126 RepID=A0ABN9R140_9DINO|nr:unnamed protein product [Polarella glacialis]